MLDAILCPEWEYRYYCYDQRWAPGHQRASMRDGTGNEYSVVFSAPGALIRGFAPDSVQEEFRADPPPCWRELADGTPTVTAMLWRERGDLTWQARPEDGDEAMFGLLADGSPEAYHRFAQDYFEVTLDLAAVARVFSHEPLTHELVQALTLYARIEDLVDDCAAIGWALSGRVPVTH